MVMTRYDVYLVTLNPTTGHEINKTRPCVIVSPDEMNRNSGTVIIAPLTSKARNYPTRLDCTFQSKSGQVVLDQIRAVDKIRLVKRLGKLAPATAERVSDVLVEMFRR